MGNHCIIMFYHIISLILSIFLKTSHQRCVVRGIALLSASTGEPTWNWLAWQASGSLFEPLAASSHYLSLTLGGLHDQARHSRQYFGWPRRAKTRPPDHTPVNWPVGASASGSAQVGSGGHHRWAMRVQVGQEPARQKAREGYPSHYTSLITCITKSHQIW